MSDIKITGDLNYNLSHDVPSRSEKTPCINLVNPGLVVYGFSGTCDVTTISRIDGII